jgi:heavy metal sensor kinase
MKFFGNIKFRLTSWYLLIVAILIALFGISGYFLLVEGLSRNIVTPYDMRIADIATLPDGNGRITGFTSISGQIGVDAGYHGMQIPVSRLLESMSDNQTVEIQAFGAKPILVDRGILTGPDNPSGEQMWVHLFISKNDPADRKLVVAAQSKADLKSIIAIFRRTMLIAAGITLFVAGILGFLIVWRILRPLQAITRATQGMTTKNLKGRLKVDRQDELGELASSLNRMFDRVETAFDAERQVTADLSHELRTPLAIAQAETSLALTRGRSDKDYQKALETVSREITHLSAITNRLLFLARSENGSGLTPTVLDLRELLEEIASDTEGLCQNKGLIFQSRLPEGTDNYLIEGDRVRLRELFLNLIGNAVRYTPTGGTITLSLNRQDGFILAAVSDTGIGISQEHLPHIFERFYRVNQADPDNNGGAGLGLAICKRIVELHGGRIEVESKPGVGTTFTVYLPQQPSD